jgi:hypothetical protein
LSPSSIEIAGWGAVSPAGWSSAELFAAVENGEPLAHELSEREGRTRPVLVRRVPKPTGKFPWLRQPRLRRTSPIARFCVSAALEAIGEQRMAAVESGEHRLGVIYALVNGCVNYSQRFFREVLDDPSLASPIVFPETVFNAPASHLSAMLGTNAINYTVVGDSATFLPALELATDWLADGLCDGVVVIGGEEFDWLSAEAFQLFHHEAIVSEGAGALYLEKSESPGIELQAITDPALITNHRPRAAAIATTRNALDFSPGESDALFDSRSNLPTLDTAETAAWSDWPATATRHSARRILGDGMGTSVPWQCAAAAAWLTGQSSGSRAIINAAGTNEQVAATIFEKM